MAFGDSITDGYHSTIGTYTHRPDFLATRLAAGPGPQRLSVVDAGRDVVVRLAKGGFLKGVAEGRDLGISGEWLGC
ncbi:hypothetical protein AB0C68_40475 [Streptomyces tendae]|uniref:hypothetical protein n=1 Tax=Streptomyces tendae TaxID=1932 RepID=UPI00340DB19B